MVQFPLLSKRLEVRPFEDADLPGIHEVYSDLQVMQYVAYGHPNETLTDTAGAIERYRVHQEAHGFSFWAIVERGQQTIVGDVGFEVQPDGVIDFGYTLGRPWWGKGYATEAGRLCLDALLDEVAASTIQARVDPQNPASSRVLEKLGFRLHGRTIAYGREHRVYTLV